MFETTQFLALMIGGYMLVSGIGLLISTDYYARMVADSANSDPITLSLAGTVTFAIGLAIVIGHFKWDGPTEALVSLFGLIALIKGVFLIALPAGLLQWAPKIGAGSLRLGSIGFLLWGGYLLYAGLSAT